MNFRYKKLKNGCIYFNPFDLRRAAGLLDQELLRELNFIEDRNLKPSSDCPRADQDFINDYCKGLLNKDFIILLSNIFSVDSVQMKCDDESAMNAFKAAFVSEPQLNLTANRRP